MRFSLATRYADYDTKGHVNNAVFLTYFEIARERAWVDAMGQESVDFPFILAEATVRYASEAMVGDALDVEITTVDVRTKAWVWAYTIRRSRDDAVVAEGRTVQVMFDYAAKRTVPIPDEIRERLPRV
jgi:acyl-CoA thioester hydrolase